MGTPLLRLTTLGAKSGQRHTVTLGYLPDGVDRWLIFGSAGGSPRHPAWYHNLVRHPDQVTIQIGPRTLRVRPETLSGAEREAAWQRRVVQSPRSATYLDKTAPCGGNRSR